MSASTPSTKDLVLEWLLTGEVGMSSTEIAAFMIGVTPRRHNIGYPNHPRDPADFRRCQLLLDKIPEFRSRLPEMAWLSEEWAALVRYWDEIERTFSGECPAYRDPAAGWSAPATYRLMCKLREVGEP